MPPVKEAWSVTVYSLAGTLIRDLEKRYQFNRSVQLDAEPDRLGGHYLQAMAPADPAQKAEAPVAAGQGLEVIGG